MKLIKEYYANGCLKAKGLMEGDLKQGKWMFYYENGELQMEVNYKDNIESGEFKRWYQNGNLAVETFYLQGKNSGSWKEYYENGKVKEVGEYKNGEYSPTDFWDEEGIQLLRNGTGKKIEKFGYSELDVYEQYFEDSKFIKEVKISSAHYGKFEQSD